MTPYALGRLLAAALLLFSVAAPLRAQGLETGAATIAPWSGWSLAMRPDFVMARVRCEGGGPAHP